MKSPKDILSALSYAEEKLKTHKDLQTDPVVQASLVCCIAGKLVIKKKYPDLFI